MNAYCRDHCFACGRHFSSLEAFDRHRVGSFRDPDDPRRCTSPIDVTNQTGEAVYEVRDPGACTITDEKPALVWGLAGAREDAARRLRTAKADTTTAKPARRVQRSSAERKSPVRRAA